MASMKDKVLVAALLSCMNNSEGEINPRKDDDDDYRDRGSSEDLFMVYGTKEAARRAESSRLRNAASGNKNDGLFIWKRR